MNLPMLRRRVERYAQLLDEAQTGTRATRHRHAKQPADDEVAAMVALATRLSAATDEVQLPADRREAMRARLMQAAETVGTDAVDTEAVEAETVMAEAAEPVMAEAVAFGPLMAETVAAGPLMAETVAAGPLMAETVAAAPAMAEAVTAKPSPLAKRSAEGAADATIGADRMSSAGRAGDGPSMVGRAAVGTVHGSLAARGRLLPRQRAVRRTGRRRPRRNRIKIVVLGGLAISTLAVSGISAASGGAQPGDVLYGMKRVAENAQIDLAGSDTKKASLYLQDAQRRLDEARQVTAGGNLVIDTLTTMDAQTTDGAKLLFSYAMTHHDAGPLTTLDAFVTSQNNMVTSWAGTSGLSAKLSAKLTASGVLLDRIKERSTEVRGAVGCSKAPKVLASDDLGTEPSCPA